MQFKLWKRVMSIFVTVAVIVNTVNINAFAADIQGPQINVNTNYYFDFTSSISSAANGYVGVDQATVYSEETKYGWEVGSATNVSTLYRSAPKTSVKENGFAYGTENAKFIADVQQEGTYLVSVASGDRLASGMDTTNMSIYANGNPAVENINVTKGTTQEECFLVTLEGTTLLSLEFLGDCWSVSTVEIRKYNEAESNGGEKAFISDADGNITIEAETALEESDYAWTGAGLNNNWTKVAGDSGYAMFNGPNSTAGYAYTVYDTAYANSPKMNYTVNFQETGTYYVWVLMCSAGADDDSLFALLNDQSNSMPLVNLNRDTGGKYEWVKLTSGINVVITETGEHKISIYGREDGVKLDKLMLTKDTEFTPTGLGGKMYRESDVVITDNDFKLFKDNEVANIYFDTNNEYTQVAKAAEDLVTDIESVTGAVPNLTYDIAQLGSNAIIAGTIGHSDIIDSLIEEGKLDVSDVSEEWEAFTIKIIDNPVAGVEKALVIAGSDKRGTIYGIYEVSEQIGVSPWYWWGDVTIDKQSQIILAPEDVEKTEKPDVKYRGIFLNDEENFTVWSEKFENDTNSQGTPNANAYAKVFELMLRLKANTLWPAMHEQSDAFNQYINPETGISYNAELADEYGIVMSSSHAEMLLCSNPIEWVPWCEANIGKYNLKKLNNDWKSSYDYTVNAEAMNAYWDDRVATNYKYENIYMIGLRAVHDSGILCSGLGANATYEQKATVVKSAVEAQVAILDKYEKKYKEETGENIVFAKAFCPYKEAAEYYKYDLGLPSDTTILWSDDNYGYVRQYSTTEELNKYAGAGVYYHVSYWGFPGSYLWLATTPLSLMYEEMHKSYQAGSDDYWILNVGDLKPSEIPMEFFMDLAWDVDCTNSDGITEYMTKKFVRDFKVSEKTATDITDIVTQTYQICSAKKPEFAGLDQGTEYSLVDYGDESQKMVDKLEDLYNRSELIYKSLPEEEKDSYYEFVHYMVCSAKLTAEKNIYAQKSKLYLQQGRFLSVNGYAKLANNAYKQILKDIDYYNLEVADGKWQGILDPYQNVNGLPKIDFEPDVSFVSSNQAVEGIGAVCEGQSSGNENITISFNSISNDNRFIDVFTTGYNKQDYTITTDKSVILTKCDGTLLDSQLVDGKLVYTGSVEVEERLWVSIDWSKVDSETNIGSIIVKDETGFEKKFKTSYVKSILDVEADKQAGTLGYYETNGIVSIEAEHFSKTVAVDGQEWRKFKDLGNSGDSMKVYPDTSSANKCLFANNISVETAIQTSPYIEYNVYFDKTGTYNGVFYRIPTLNEGKYDDGTSKSCRVLVGLDDGIATMIRGNSVVSETGGSLWSINVQGNIEERPFTIKVDTSGWHKIRVIKADAGIAFDSIVLNHSENNAITSRLGATESYQTITEVNTTKVSTPPVLTAEGIAVGEADVVEKYLLDFSASGANAQGGYISVSADTSAKKYGWVSNESSDKKSVHRSTAAKTSARDKGFVYGTTNDTFKLKTLSAGTYRVGIAVGDRDATGYTVSNMSVKANGNKALSDINVNKGNTMEYTFTVEVDSNCEIKLEFSGDLWAVSSLEIWPEETILKDNGKGAFIQDYKGYINIDAESALENSDYASITKAQDNSETSWFETNGISGSGIFFGPMNTAAYTNTSYSGNKAPKAEYAIDFENVGSYNVWLLVKAECDDDDSILMSFDQGTAVVLNDIRATDGGFIWKKAGTVNVNSVGKHQLTLMGREDGLSVDKIVLSMNSTSPIATGGKMMRKGASLDSSVLKTYIQKAEEILAKQKDDELKAAVDLAKKVLNGTSTQNQIDKSADELKQLLSGVKEDSTDYSDLQRALLEAKQKDLTASQRKSLVTLIYNNLSLLTDDILNQNIEDMKRASYSFEGDWKNSVNKEDIAISSHLGSGTDPVLATDAERGKVAQVKAGSVDNASQISVNNPFRGQILDNGATVSIWVKSSNIDNYGFIWSASTKYNNVWLAGAPYFGYNGSNGYVDLNCPHSLPGPSDKQGYLKNSKWNLVTTTITEDEVIVYVNGSKILSTLDKNYVAGQNTEYMNRVITLLKTADTIEIGGHNLYWGSANMLVDDFELYDTALSNEQVAKLYTGTVDTSMLALAIDSSYDEANKKNTYTSESINLYKLEIKKAEKVMNTVGVSQRDIIDSFKQLFESSNLLKKASLPTPTVTKVAISPSSAVVVQGKSQIFKATVIGTNSPSQAVTWSVSGNKSSQTKITASGKLTVGANEKSTTITVKAISKANSKKYVAIKVKVAAKKGTAFTSGSYKYKITNQKTNGKGTVILTGFAKKKTSTTVKVSKTVKFKGITYKVTAVGKRAFYKNRKIKSVKVQGNVTKIGKQAFSRCSKLTKVVIGNKVTEISTSAFSSCTKLKTVTIGTGLKKIGKQAFSKDTRLNKMTIKSKKLKSIGKQSLYKVKKLKIKVPSSKVKAYKKLLKKSKQSKNVKITK